MKSFLYVYLLYKNYDLFCKNSFKEKELENLYYHRFPNDYDLATYTLFF